MAELTIASTEKMFALQMALTQGYFELGMQQLKSAMEIKDAETLQSFMSKQAEVAKTVGEKVMADAKAVADLNAEVSAEVQKLAQEGVITSYSIHYTKLYDIDAWFEALDYVESNPDDAFQIMAKASSVS